MAEQDYWAYTLEHPGEYFELVRVEHTEECLQHNGKPDVSPNGEVKAAPLRGVEP